jgi:2-polyprenyl-3-methyl-5-hydroxy-6-metoxy-1,4-benzoquinol methylase
VKELRLVRPRILDLGCATGWLTAQLAELGLARGTDIADASIRQARERYPDIPFDCVDFSSSSYEQESFDIVVSLETLSHVADQRAFFQQIARILKPGGYLILTTQNRFVFERRADVAPKGAGQIRQWVTGRDLRQLLRDDFVVRRFTTMIPVGDVGILRLVNSPRVNGWLSRLVPRATIDGIKERFGLGQTIAVLAQRR